MELCDGGDLLQYIEKQTKFRELANEKTIWKYFIQMIKGLKTLHDKNIVHRDIKCANVFLMKSGDLKLGDLNVSKVARKGELLSTQTGTPYYASPEVWKDQPYNAMSDIWSAGCVLYEMVMLNPPFKGRDMNDLYSKIMRGVYPALST